MTKNSDVSWIPKPVGCSLKRFTTDELKNCPFCYCGATAKQWNKRYTTHICPQFGVIGAVCSDPENLCDQYVFCKRARELQKTCLSSIDNITLMAESVRRGLATVEPDTLPQWAIDVINHMIDTCNIKNEDYALGYLAALDDVLYLRKPEGK
jgi:hypothetical protein